LILDNEFDFTDSKEEKHIKRNDYEEAYIDFGDEKNMNDSPNSDGVRPRYRAVVNITVYDEENDIEKNYRFEQEKIQYLDNSDN